MIRPVADGPREHAGPLAGLAWLAGAWTGTVRSAGGPPTARWWCHYSSPAGGVIVGSSKEFALGPGGESTGRLTLFEHERFVVEDDRVLYRPMPRGRAVDPFVLDDASSAAAGWAVFRAAENDFPHVVAFERAGPDRLTIWLRGEPDPAGGRVADVRLELAREAAP